MADKRKSIFDSSKDGRQTKEPTTTFLDRALTIINKITGMSAPSPTGAGRDAFKTGLTGNPGAVPKAVGGIFNQGSAQLDEARRRREARQRR